MSNTAWFLILAPIGFLCLYFLAYLAACMAANRWLTFKEWW